MEEALAYLESTRDLISQLDSRLRSLYNLCQPQLRRQVLGSESFIGWNETCMELGHIVGRAHEMQEDMEMIAQFWKRRGQDVANTR